jgi:hypothetical protein
VLLTTSEKQRQDVVCALTESKGGSVAPTELPHAWALTAPPSSRMKKLGINPNQYSALVALCRCSDHTPMN